MASMTGSPNPAAGETEINGEEEACLIVTDEELGGAPNEGVDVASSNFPSITNRGLSNQ